jgi:nitroreductase
METKILEVLRDRKPTRAISDQPVEREKLMAMLEAARLSASCGNIQSWRFLALTEPDALEKGREALSRGNYWAKTAPVLIFGYSKPDLDCQLKDGREYYVFDLGMAVQNILLQATELDLVARPFAGLSQDKVKELFGLEQEYSVLVGIAIGYEGDTATLTEKHQLHATSPRERKPLAETVSFEVLG